MSYHNRNDEAADLAIAGIRRIAEQLLDVPVRGAALRSILEEFHGSLNSFAQALKPQRLHAVTPPTVDHGACYTCDGFPMVRDE